MRRKLEAVDHTVGKEDDRIGPAVVPAAGRTENEADRIDQVAGHIESEVDRTAQPADRIEIEADQVSGHTGKKERQGEEGTALAKELRQACYQGLEEHQEGEHTAAVEEHRMSEEWGIAAGEHRIAVVVDHTAAAGELAGKAQRQKQPQRRRQPGSEKLRV